MGATTVLMAAGLELPEQVKGIIADCGFTSPYEVMEATMRRWKLLPHPYLDLMCPVVKLFGIDLKLNTMDALKKCRIPVLLIHGTADDIVPHEMSVRNYEACAGKKGLVLVEGAGHGCSYMVDKEKCEKALKDFLTENCRQRGD